MSEPISKKNKDEANTIEQTKRDKKNRKTNKQEMHEDMPQTVRSSNCILSESIPRNTMERDCIHFDIVKEGNTMKMEQEICIPLQTNTYYASNPILVGKDIRNNMKKTHKAKGTPHLNPTLVQESKKPILTIDIQTMDDSVPSNQATLGSGTQTANYFESIFTGVQSDTPILFQEKYPFL
jgi:hypothetical protein